MGCERVRIYHDFLKLGARVGDSRATRILSSPSMWSHGIPMARPHLLVCLWDFRGPSPFPRSLRPDASLKAPVSDIIAFWMVSHT